MPDDAGLPQTIDAGSPPQASSDAGDPPVITAGSPDAGDVPDASTAAVSIVPDAGPIQPCDASPDGFDVSVPSEAEKMACQPNPVPNAPVAPAFDGGVAGPCDETYPPNASIGHSLRTFDAKGHLLAQVDYDNDGGVLGSAENIYDSCGDLLWFRNTGSLGEFVRRSHLGSDGQISRVDSQQGTACTSNSIGYEHDEQGRVSAVLHPDLENGVDKIAVTYGADGHTAMLDYGFANVTYLWFPGGAMQEQDSQTTSGFFRNITYDEKGRLLDSQGTATSTNSFSSETDTYRDDGQLLSSSGSTDSGCSGSSWETTLTYAGGLLIREYSKDETYAGCVGQPTLVSKDFTYPQPNVQVAQIKDSRGADYTVRTVFDSRGNALTVEQSNPTGSPWVQTLEQTFEGCGAIPP